MSDYIDSQRADDAEDLDWDNFPETVLNDDELEAVAELRYLRDEQKLLKERESVLRAELLARMGATEMAVNIHGTPVLTVKRSTRRNVSGSKLEAKYPEIYEECMSESTVTTLNLP